MPPHCQGQYLRIPYRCAVIEAVLGLRVRRVEPLLQKVEAQHPFNPDRPATSLPGGVMRLNQRRDRSPRDHKVHLRQEVLSPRLLMGAIKAEAGEALLMHGGQAKRLNGLSETEPENQSQDNRESG